MKIVVANSVGIDDQGYFIIHSPSRWSEGVENKENWFAYYPWELAYTSSLLKTATPHTIKFIDGCLECLCSRDYIEKIALEKPDWLIMESATRVIEDNLKIALKIKKRFNTRLIFCGQHATAYPEELLKQGVDFVCLGEYENTVLDIILGKKPSKIKGLYPNQRRPLLDINTLPFPEDKDVSRLNYGLPGEPSSEYLEIQMYATRGCLMSCTYCVARNLYYEKPNYRVRDIQNIIQELKYLKNKYPKLEGIFFDEEDHTGNKIFNLNLSQAIIESKLHNLHYEAMCNLYNLDEEIMNSMKEAGYYKLRVGIETGSPTLAQQINKPFDLNKIRETLKVAKKTGLKMYGTFMFGLPPGNKKEDLKTISLIKELIQKQYLHNVQISILTPQPITPFFKQIEKPFLSTKEYKRFDGGRISIINYPEYSSQQIKALHTYALNMRDHLFLTNKIKHGLFSWIKIIYSKQGGFALMKKLFLRMSKEINFLKNRKKTEKKLFN